MEFRRLAEIDRADIIDLMNHPLVRRHLPLLRGCFGSRECEQFVAAKEQLWIDHGYGPWAFVDEGRFVGWGGLQPENGDVDLGLVLHPDYWGRGRALYETISERAFGEMGLESITIHLPPSRKQVASLSRMGFRSDGEVVIEGERFLRYRKDRAVDERTAVRTVPES